MAPIRSFNQLVAAGLLFLTLSQSAMGFWRLPCRDHLVVERLDPIVNPGGISGHLHSIMGASNFAANVNSSILKQSKCSSCNVREDLSNYWVPSLFFQFANGSFVNVPQNGGMLAYYLQRGQNGEKLLAFPEDFRMLAGTPNLRSYDKSSLEQRAVSFVCLNYAGESPETPQIPSKNCVNGLRAQVFFPSCWDGKNTDSPDHKSHVAYMSGMNYGACPKSHPKKLVSLFYEVIFKVEEFNQLRSQAKNPKQPFVFAQGDPTGYGFHGDFLMGWDRAVLQRAVNTCTNESGRVEDCPEFSYFPKDSTCKKTPSVNQQSYGILPKLPGCNPVTDKTSPLCQDTSPPGLLKSVIFTTPAPPSTAKLPPGYPRAPTSGSGYTYKSCYRDTAQNWAGPRTLSKQMTISGKLTIEKCLAKCKEGNFRYCGLEGGNECWAANTMQSEAKDLGSGNCAKVCNGDGLQYCGDSWALSVYERKEYVPTTVTNPGGKSGKFIGCLTDSLGSRALTTSKSASSMTIAKCLTACATFKYAGVEYGSECYCGNSVSGGNDFAAPKTDPIAAGCDMPCAGNGSEYCGGGGRLNLYAIKSATKKVKRVHVGHALSGRAGHFI